MHAWPLDVTDLAAVRRAVPAIEAKHGAITLAVLNAGMYTSVKLDTFKAETFADHMRVNYQGVVNCMDPLSPPCAAQAGPSGAGGERRRLSGPAARLRLRPHQGRAHQPGGIPEVHAGEGRRPHLGVQPGFRGDAADGEQRSSPCPS